MGKLCETRIDTLSKDNKRFCYVCHDYCFVESRNQTKTLELPFIIKTTLSEDGEANLVYSAFRLSVARSTATGNGNRW